MLSIDGYQWNTAIRLDSFDALVTDDLCDDLRVWLKACAPWGHAHGYEVTDEGLAVLGCRWDGERYEAEVFAIGDQTAREWVVPPL